MTEPVTRCLVVAGERSGEQHCLDFFDSLKRLRPDVQFWGVGGDELAGKGMKLLYHLKDFSGWGIGEILTKIPFYMKALKVLERQAVASGTKYAVLIDFQEFNMILTRRLKKHGICILYYAAPQAWAWRSYRAAILGKNVHTLFTLLPFEKPWFEQRGVAKVVPVAHPIYNHFKDRLPTTKKKPSHPFILTLLPGSRNFEVRRLLPEFIRAVAILKKSQHSFKVNIVRSSSVAGQLYTPYLGMIDAIFEDDRLAEVLDKSDYALAASGTVTLACALFNVPTVVSYQASLLTELASLCVLDYKGPISLPNIILAEKVFPELVQEKVSAYNIARHLCAWIDDPRRDERSRESLLKVRKLVQGDGTNFAEYIAKVMGEP